MAAEHRNEDYPEEIDDQLTSFDSSVSSVKTMLEKLMSIPKNVQPQKVGITLKNKQQQHLSMLLSTRFYQLDFPLIRPQIMEPYHRQPYTCIILTESIRRLPEVWDEPHLLPLLRRFNQKWFLKKIFHWGLLLFLYLQLNPLDQAKLDLMSVYTLNSLFWSKFSLSRFSRLPKQNMEINKIHQFTSFEHCRFKCRWYKNVILKDWGILLDSACNSLDYCLSRYLMKVHTECCL